MTQAGSDTGLCFFVGVLVAVRRGSATLNDLCG